MVYIYGGGYVTGSIFKDSHDARYIAYRGDLVVVLMNYRTGPFGFMYGGTDESANLGLYDQILALQWVQSNIAQFGGNPDQVTIFGNSAGAGSVAAMILSPLTLGLFHRSIIQSGTPNFLHKNDSFRLTESLQEKLNCLNVECIKLDRSVEQILNASKELGNPFKPVYGDQLLPIRPIDAVKNGAFNAHIDLMYGITKDESSSTVLSKFPELNNESLSWTREQTKYFIQNLIGSEFGQKAADFYVNLVDLPEQPSLNESRYE